MLVLGHRGDPNAAPGNTLAALKAAVEAGADGVEFDVQLSKDGQFVLTHDLEAGGRPVHQHTRAELAVALGHPVDVLGDVLTALPKAFLYVEFKRQGSLAELAAATQLTRRLRARDPDRTMLASFDPWFLKAAFAADPGVPLGLILDGRMLTGPDEFPAGDLPFVGTVSFALELLDGAVPSRAKAAGKRLFVWPVDEDADLKRVLADGRLAGVVTKRPKAAVELRKR
jgi:glycerophosphoryl diester phosphodiesterase